MRLLRKWWCKAFHEKDHREYTEQTIGRATYQVLVKWQCGVCGRDKREIYIK